MRVKVVTCGNWTKLNGAGAAGQDVFDWLNAILFSNNNVHASLLDYYILENSKLLVMAKFLRCLVY